MTGRGTDSEDPKMRLMPITAALAACAIALVGCGDDDESAGSPDEYCELVAALDAAGEAEFEGLGADATEEDFAAAFSAFFEGHRADIERLQEVAPEEIRDDVITLVEIQREAGETGDLSALESDESAQADERVQLFEEESCDAGAGDDPDDRGEVEE